MNSEIIVINSDVGETRGQHDDFPYVFVRLLKGIYKDLDNFPCGNQHNNGKSNI